MKLQNSFKFLSAALILLAFSFRATATILECSIQGGRQLVLFQETKTSQANSPMIVVLKEKSGQGFKELKTWQIDSTVAEEKLAVRNVAQLQASLKSSDSAQFFLTDSTGAYLGELTLDSNSTFGKNLYFRNAGLVNGKEFADTVLKISVCKDALGKEVWFAGKKPAAAGSSHGGGFLLDENHAQ